MLKKMPVLRTIVHTYIVNLRFSDQMHLALGLFKRSHIHNPEGIDILI